MSTIEILFLFIFGLISFCVLGTIIEELRKGDFTKLHFFILCLSEIGSLTIAYFVFWLIPYYYQTTKEKVNASFKAQALAVYQYQQSLEKTK